MDTLKSFLNAGILSQARLLDAMTSTLRMYLPTQVAEHCWVGGVRDRTLVVITDSASFTVAAHYQQHDILERINTDFHADLPAPLIRLKTKIAKLPRADKTNPLTRPTLSAGSARGLESAAANITDEELKFALTRLADRGKRG